MLKKIVETCFGVVCFFIYFSGLYHLISYLKRHRPVILMYHSVNERGCEYVHPNGYINTVQAKNLEKQLRYLFREKRIVSLSELAEHVKDKTEFPPDLIAITFDDGYYDFRSTAYPILRKYGIPSTVFVVTRRLDPTEANWDDQLLNLINTTETNDLRIRIEERYRYYSFASQAGKLDCIRDLHSLLAKMNAAERCKTLCEIESRLHFSEVSKRITLNWNDVLNLQEEKLVSFGSHTHDHCNLAKVSYEMAEQEIIRSKEELEGLLKKPCTLFSYPFGRRRDFNQEIKKMLKAKGFVLAVAAIPGSISKDSDLYELKRVAAPDDASYKFKCSLIGITLQNSAR